MKIELIPFYHPMLANCWLVIDEKSKEAAVIDASAYNSSVLQTINEIEKVKLKYILQTHGHFDHILGVCDLKEATGAEVAIHELDSDCLYDPSKSLANQNAPNAQKPVHADILLKDADELKLGDETIKVMHTPGHTMGSVCYILENERVIFSGDTLFCRTVGRTDFYGGDPEQMKRSLKRLISLDGDYRVFPGHNRTTTLDEERTGNIIIRRM